MRIANNKLSYDIIDKLMLPVLTTIDEHGDIHETSNVTSHEIDLLLYLSLRQNAFGIVSGIHYKEAMIDLGLRMNQKQTFYNSLYGLEEKGYIRINYQRKDVYWEIQILENIFQNDDDDQKGYFNTNREFLFTKAFRELKANEKKLCIKFTISYTEKNFESYGFSIYPETVAKWIGLKSVSLVYRYMESIEQFFPNIRKDGIDGELFYLPKGNYTPFRNTKSTERENHLTHKLKHFCSVHRVAYTIQDIKDLIILMGQYASKGLGKLYGTICDVLLSKRSIEPKLINSLLSGKFDPGQDKSNGLLSYRPTY